MPLERVAPSELRFGIIDLGLRFLTRILFLEVLVATSFSDVYIDTSFLVTKKSESLKGLVRIDDCFGVATVTVSASPPPSRALVDLTWVESLLRPRAREMDSAPVPSSSPHALVARDLLSPSFSCRSLAYEQETHTFSLAYSSTPMISRIDDAHSCRQKNQAVTAHTENPWLWIAFYPIGWPTKDCIHFISLGKFRSSHFLRRPRVPFAEYE